MELQHVWLTGDLGYATYKDFIADNNPFSLSYIESLYDDSELTLGVF